MIASFAYRGVRSRLAAPLLMASLIAAAAPSAALCQNQVAEDDAIAEEAASDAGPWEPTVIEPREADGKPYWQRQSSDAFVDPDKRMDLVPKYYFVVPVSLYPLHDEQLGDSLRRGPKLTIAQQDQIAELFDKIRRPGMQWLDYEAGDKANSLVVMSLPAEPRPAKAVAKLSINRLAVKEGLWKLEKTLHQREMPADDLPVEVPGGAGLDTYDRPAELASLKTLVGRVIAVLKRVGGRDAVDFYTETLNEEGDCRLWLAPENHPLGRATGIRFVRLPIKRDTGKISQVDVLAVMYRDADENRKVVAFDYPLCATPALLQMRAFAERFASKDKPTKVDPAATDQATALLGVDLSDELARRLVNALSK